MRGGVLPIVIVHRNQPARCVGTVAAFRDQGVPVHIVVVDSGSEPAAVAQLRSAFAGVQDVELALLEHNVGFGPGANAGLRRALAGEGDWIAVAPHDSVPAPGCLAGLLEAVAVLPRAGRACADVGDDATPMVDRYLGGLVSPARVAAGWEPAAYPHGTLMLARRACLEEVGLFDERYFAYCEEADLGLRARRGGWEVGVVRGADVRNGALSTASATVDYLQQRNTLLLVRTHFGRYPAMVRLALGLAALARGLVHPPSRPLVFVPRARLRGMADHLRGRYGPPPDQLQDRRFSGLWLRGRRRG
ncbi:glycosyltransferase family 2 protein [soil metagenome]